MENNTGAILFGVGSMLIVVPLLILFVVVLINRKKSNKRIKEDKRQSKNFNKKQELDISKGMIPLSCEDPISYVRYAQIDKDLYKRMCIAKRSGVASILIESSTFDEIERKYNQGKIQEYLDTRTAETNTEGIKLEKEGRMSEAIDMYEENISLQIPATHAYHRLMVIYRRMKNYENELRVIRSAIKVFSKENERRAYNAIDSHPDLYDEILEALELNTELRLKNGSYIFNQYDIMKLIDRGEKVKKLMKN